MHISARNEHRMQAISQSPKIPAYDKEIGHRGSPPDRAPVLREKWLKVIQKLGPKGLIIGENSMGGCIASLVAGEVGVAGFVCLGYPFHPVGKPDNYQACDL
jgi:predicted alpha/beta-hydrolase family hydrolase